MMELDRSTFLDKKLTFYQAVNGFRFGTDSFLLADFARLKDGEKFVELGVGCGVITILLLKKYPNCSAVGIDVLEENVKISELNARENEVKDRLTLLRLNVKDVKSYLPPSQFDAVITNPPFIKNSGGLQSPNKLKAVARHEIEASFKDFVEAAGYLLKPKGRLYLLFPTFRLTDALCECRFKGIEPKEIAFIHPSLEEEPHLFLLKAVKGAKGGLRVRKPVVVYISETVRKYTDEMEERYKRFFELK